MQPLESMSPIRGLWPSIQVAHVSRSIKLRLREQALPIPFLPSVRIPLTEKDDAYHMLLRVGDDLAHQAVFAIVTRVREHAVFVKAGVGNNLTVVVLQLLTPSFQICPSCFLSADDVLHDTT